MDAQHKTTTAITKSCGVLCLETLNVKGMRKNRKLSKALLDASLGELHRQFEYKAKLHSVNLVRADRFYPSSKTCSNCGKIKSDLVLSDRVFECKCGLEMDRDLNSAINLRNLAAGYADSKNACGDEGAGFGFRVKTKLLSAKQEGGDLRV
jgi:putative transposase